VLSASSPSLRLGFSGSDFIFILPRVPPLTRLHPGLLVRRPAVTGLRNSAHFRSHVSARQTPIYLPICLIMQFYFMPPSYQTMENALFDLFLPADLKQTHARMAAHITLEI
jgi:hypothetical protein